MKHIRLIFSASLVLLGLIGLGRLLVAGAAADSKAKSIEAFMSARMLENNVAARNLMTANLEDDYVRGKKLSVRVRSGRIAAFDYDPASIESSGNKEFRVIVRSVWADLNEQVYDTETERLKFISLNNEWLADGIDLQKKSPILAPPPQAMEDYKRFRAASAIAKKFAKAVVNQNSQMIMELTNQKFQNQFKSASNLLASLQSAPDLLCSAYDFRNYKIITPRKIEFKMGFYMVTKGKGGFKETEGVITAEEGGADYVVTAFVVSPAQP